MSEAQFLYAMSVGLILGVVLGGLATLALVTVSRRREGPTVRR